MAVKLRGVLIFVLTAGMIAVVVVLFFGLGLHLFTAKSSRAVIRHPAVPTPKVTVPPLGSVHGAAFHIPVAALLYAVLVVVLLAGVVLSIWRARRLRPPGGPRETTSSRRTPRTCGRQWTAVRPAHPRRRAGRHHRLLRGDGEQPGQRGAALGVADTPDELLARARDTGVVRGAAVARLTALFYEARFSSHPLDRSQRDAAGQALDELAATLAQTETAETAEGGAGA